MTTGTAPQRTSSRYSELQYSQQPPPTPVSRGEDRERFHERRGLYGARIRRNCWLWRWHWASSRAESDRVLISGGNSDPLQLYGDTDGTGLVLLASSTNDGEPAWAPGGDKLAFTGDGDIYTMNADGGARVNISNNPAGDDSPFWSPDGSQIVFISFRDGNNEIYKMNSNGSGVVRLTNSPASDIEPTWSPDGTKIAFASDRGGRWIEPNGIEPKSRHRLQPSLVPRWNADGICLLSGWEQSGSVPHECRWVQSGQTDQWPQ